MLSKNPLDLLFKDIRRDLWEAQQTKPLSKPQPPPLSTYANPLNWKVGRAIQIIHHSEGSLGVFLEYSHRLSPTARRLLPAPPDTTPQTSELVFGDWWLHPRNAAPGIVEDEAEISAIKKRFWELIQELEDEIDED